MVLKRSLKKNMVQPKEVLIEEARMKIHVDKRRV